VAASEFVAAAVQTCGALIESRQQRLTIDLGAPANDVDGDPVRLAQVVGNLLHNAAKYTPAGGAITLSTRRKGETGVIRVVDDGMGISAEALPHVFDLFKQDERALGRSQGGLGIGLTVVRSMVELHGGTVEARSAGLDQGSEFIVTLPRLADRAGASVAPLPAPPIGTIAAAAVIPAHILLVEDNEDAGDMLAILLRLAGHDVTLARSGESALAMLLAAPPQVVVCDVGLPGMSGYELAAKVREQRRGAMPLMIALTGYGGIRERDLSLAAGFAHHLVKPADPQALLRLISAGLASSSA
ncbi:MAG: ATP-binding protein, partial [Caldimonas sp.]